MRKIIKDEKDLQVQVDEDGTEYYYVKEHLKHGDRKSEYSLVLQRRESNIKGESFRTYVKMDDITSRHYIIIQWPGVRP
jgi:hypothetical protein